MSGTEKPLFDTFEENIEYLRKEMRIEDNFDLIHHKLVYGERKFGLFFVDAFAKDEVMVHIMRHLSFLNKEDLEGDPITILVQKLIPHLEVETTEDLEEVISQTLAGQAAFIIEGCEEAILVDIREYPGRSPEEPDIERVVRGPRDGFVETLVFNTGLMRRRLRDRSLVMEFMQVGRRSKTDISIAYIDSVADPELIKRVKEKLEAIKIDGLTMAEKTVEEFMFKKNLLPYPLVRYTERPDTAATHVLEGHVLIFVDGSPSVMICPTTYWHHLQHAEEYRQEPVIGVFLRWVRFIAVWSSIFLLPLWFLYATVPEIVPDFVDYIGPDDTGAVPLIAQFLIAEVGLEILRMAAIHTPNALATALGLVAAILIGEVAIEVGLFTHEVILYIALAALSSYATPSYEMSISNRIIRILLLVATSLFGVAGFVGGTALFIISLASLKTMNTPYLWPFIPFNGKAFVDILFRTPMPMKNTRPSVLNTLDQTRQ
ncbi:spore germination protein [Salipaludibacillus sp. CUR1]|uniref:spore germination protein n=1 Tax=Salipaludibacillus sp. CUR1 TaxID=2820003 RepID=UPI001E3E310A|nr:spore germination protein [Salipaludibacillus sp. CUR1]MCE7794061.1 spore germination protein [Salipaludibacillus sp. CUR1]